MFNVLGTLAGFVLSNSAERALRAELDDILIEGVRAWTETMVHIVPTWSGMSQGAIKVLADHVGVATFTTPVAGAPSRGAAGEAQSKAIIVKGPTEYSFTWSTEVYHFGVNENVDATQFGFNLRNPGPYNSQVKAAKVFKDTVTRRLRRLKFKVNQHYKPLRIIIK